MCVDVSVRGCVQVCERKCVVGMRESICGMRESIGGVRESLRGHEVTNVHGEKKRVEENEWNTVNLRVWTSRVSHKNHVSGTPYLKHPAEKNADDSVARLVWHANKPWKPVLLVPPTHLHVPRMDEHDSPQTLCLGPERVELW